MTLRKLVISILDKIMITLRTRGLEKFQNLRNTYGFLYSLFGKGIILIETQGHKMYLDLRDRGVCKQLLLHGVHEKCATELCKHVIKKGDIIVDVGAHVGYYTLLFARLVGEKGKVFAFEPDPENFALLMRNIEANEYRNVVAVRKAVSNKSEIAKLFLCPDNTGDHRIHNSCDSRQSIEVETTSLDEFFKNKCSKIDLIKMDIEGAEMLALQGSTKLLEKNESLQIITEFWPRSLRIFGFSPKEYLDELTERGFKLYVINENVQRIQPLTLDLQEELCENERWRGLFCKKEQ
jgi:FkbM family methyltransferase